ncbi:MAG: hypothetical protein IJ769_02595 [Clostridia bacterium]|nr:hypothetical protein [Clostridia bacterium]
MKLRLIEHKRLTKSPRTEPPADAPALTPSTATLAEKRENLYHAIERAQTFLHKRAPQDGVMARIRRYYPAPAYFIESNRQAMAKTGLSRLDAFYYAMLPSLTRTALSQQWGLNPRLDTLSRMSRYLSALYVGAHEERFYLILLNRQGRLIRAAMLQKGAVDSAPFYLGQLLATALMEDARYIVLAHNHPRGTRRPSKEDLVCTLRTLNAVASLRIPLLDHIVVVRDGVVSIRESGMIPDMLWTAPAQEHKIMQGWLDAETLAER